MLTGVEIAGLLLAILPIFQAAAEQEDTIYEGVKIAFGQKYSTRKLGEFYDNVLYEISILRINVERLVNELGDIPERDRDALRNGDDFAWSNPLVAQALQRRLRTGYESFCLTLESLHEKLDKLVKDSAADLPSDISDPKGTTSKLLGLRNGLKNGKAPSDLKDRIKFAWREEKRTALLKKITKYNERLQQLLGTPPPFQSEKKRPKYEVNTSHLHLRPLMHVLHKTMGGLWPCNCHRPHQARLCLHKCTKSSGIDHPSGGVYFDLLLSSINADATEEFCIWLESKICVILRNQLSQRSSGIVRFAINAPIQQPTPPASPDRQLARTLTGLTFGSTATTLVAKSISRTTTVVAESISPPISPTSSNSKIAVERFCETLFRYKSQLCCPRLLFDEEAGMLYHMRPTAKSTFVEASLPSQSLASLLEGKRPFGLKERRILAVILAHSMLHFCESPWVSREWNKHHITFFRRARDQRGEDIFDVSRPWLEPSFTESAKGEEKDLSQLYNIHPNPSVLALGILLLEIELNAAIEAYDNGDAIPTGFAKSNTDLFTAQRLLDPESDEHVLDKIPDKYRQSIQACLECNFVDSGFPASLEDEDFRQAVYGNIVRPLEDELWHSFPQLTPEDIGLETVGGSKKDTNVQ